MACFCLSLNSGIVECMERENYLRKLAKIYRLQLLLLFGSQAEGGQHARSDFDVAYYSRQDLDLLEEAQLAVDLVSVVKSEAVDLVNMKKAPPLLLYAIFISPKILYAKDMFFFYAMQAYALKKYAEAKPLFALRSKRLQDIIVNHKAYDI